MLGLGDDPEYLSVMGALLIFISVGQGPTVLAVGKGEGGLVLNIITSFFPFSFSFSLEKARHKLKKLSQRAVQLATKMTK